jgi:Putative restriction endonuclease
MRVEEAKRVLMLDERRYNVTFEQFDRLQELGILVGRLELAGEIGRDGQIYKLDTDDLEQAYREQVIPRDTELELVDGVLYSVPALNSDQLEQITQMATMLETAFQDRANIRQRVLLPLSARNALIPDLIVQRTTKSRFKKREPNIGDASIVIDFNEHRSETERTLRLEVYAQHGITEVWTVRDDNRSQFHRDAYEDRFGTVSVIRSDGTVAPLDFPDVEIRWW